MATVTRGSLWRRVIGGLAWRLLKSTSANESFYAALQRELAVSIGSKYPATASQMEANRSWVFAANRQIAGRAARVAPTLEMLARQPKKPVAKTTVHDHPFLDLLKQPNADEDGVVFTWRAMLMLNTAGRCYVLVEPEAIDLSAFGLPGRIGARIHRMRLLEPDRVRVEATQDRFGAWYQYTPRVGFNQPVGYPGAPATRQERAAWRANPYPFVFRVVMPAVDDYDGQSVTQAVDQAIDILNNLHQLHRGQLKNGLHSGLIFYLMKNTENMERFMEAVLLVRQGLAKAGEPLILPRGMVEVDKNPQVMSEMQFPEMLTGARQEVLAALGASEGVVGLSGSVNRSVIEGLERILALGTIDPLLALVAGGFNQFVLPLFPGQSDTLWYEMHYPSSAAADELSQTTRLVAQVNAGILTANEAREELGKAPHEEGDVLRAPGVGATPGGGNPVGQLFAEGGGAGVPSTDEQADVAAANKDMWESIGQMVPPFSSVAQVGGGRNTNGNGGQPAEAGTPGSRGRLLRGRTRD